MPETASLTLFGSPVVVGAQGRMLIGRRARAIAGYLALSETPRATRERLVGLFWADRGETQARASLRQCLVELRSAFGDTLATGREWITLNESHLAGDWATLKAALASNDPALLTASLARIGAEPLLDGMEFGESFDTWLRSSRAVLESRLAETVARQVGVAEDAGDWRIALSLADAWLVRNPTDEAIATGAIRIEVQQGATVSARRRYRAFELLLEQEGDGPPGAAMRAALEKIPAQTAPAKSEAAAPMAAEIHASAGTVVRPSVAVLPFENLSSDVEMAYFSDGVSEDILGRLVRNSRLKVIGRMSSFQFRDVNKPMAAAALNATHILDGSIRRAGSKVRITAYLAEAAGAILWSAQYDRNIEDIFAVQDEISEAIAGALDTAFFPQRSAKINPAAYDLYLQARAIYAEDLTWAAREQCIDLLMRAVSLAPDYAEAWGQLAAYRRGASAIAAAQRGLELNPDSAVSLAALAMTRPSFSGHAEKLQLAERAYRLNPDDQLVAGIYNILLLSLGLLSPALEVALARFEGDPLSPMVAGGLAMVYRSAGRTAEAHAIADHAVASFSRAGYVRFIRGAIAINDGDLAYATVMVDSDSANGEVQSLQPLIMFLQAVAAMDPANRALAVNGFLHRNAPTSAILDIGLAASTGEVDLAMDCLLETIKQGRPLEFASENDGRGMVDAAVTAGLFMPNCEALRRDLRFAEVCVRLGLFDLWREIDLWPDCMAELAPFYDFKAECTRLSGMISRYEAIA